VRVEGVARVNTGRGPGLAGPDFTSAKIVIHGDGMPPRTAVGRRSAVLMMPTDS
jgi:hypothetical protein